MFLPRTDRSCRVPFPHRPTNCAPPFRRAPVTLLCKADRTARRGLSDVQKNLSAIRFAQQQSGKVPCRITSTIPHFRTASICFPIFAEKTCMICPFFYTKDTCLFPHVSRLPPNRQFFPKNRTDLPKKEPRMRFLHLAFQHTQLAPDRACACGAKLSTFAPSTNVISPNCQGQPRKKNRFRGSFTLLFNIHNLPLPGLAPAAQGSPLRSEHERHFSSIVKAAEPELFTSANVRVRASRVPLKLSTILSS